MLTIHDVLETNQMIQKNNLDVRTITMGISLLDCCASDGKTLCSNIYDKITRYGEHLVETGEAISREYGVPIINKRVSVTPISLVAGASDMTSYVDIARTLIRRPRRSASTSSAAFRPRRTGHEQGRPDPHRFHRRKPGCDRSRLQLCRRRLD